MAYMQRALALARQALGNVSPNPAVGAVLVKEGQVVGEEFTQPPGGTHAEVVALRQAGERARGATLYTTLEPCCHYGRTPPCTQALLAAGVAEVHIGTLDPNPLVAGKGTAELEAQGVRVLVGEGQEEARQRNAGYFKFITTRLPWVVVKFAASLDGKIATAEGHSKWITGETARRRAHQLRAVCDAVMVGIETVLKDDPLLTARDEETRRARQPVRVVVDSRGRLPVGARLLREPGSTLVVVARATKSRRQELERSGAEVLQLPAEDGRVDIRALLQVLGQREITSLLAEGGGTLLGTLFDLGLVDKVVAFIAPRIIGGLNAPTPVEGIGIRELAQAILLSRLSVERVGDDIMVTGYLQG